MLNQNLKQNPFLHLQQPLNKIIELNVRTMQKLTYIPTDINPQKPEQFLEKNVEVMIQNGHKALDYMRDMFFIMEHYVFNTDALKQVHDVMHTTQMQASNAANRTLVESYRAARTGSSQVTPIKKASRSSVKKTSPKKVNIKK